MDHFELADKLEKEKNLTDDEYADHEPGTVDLTLRLLSVIRLILPDVLLPATTALGTIDPFGREKGIAAGANVVMPNLSPTDVRGKYLLYDNKICTGDESGCGNEVTEFYLQTMNIRGYVDCQGCASKAQGDPAPCVQKDDMQQIYDAYADCDVIVFAAPIYWFTISAQLKLAVDRLYAIQRNHGLEAAKRDTVFLMTSGAPAEMNPQAIEWYQTFEQMGWKSLGMALNNADAAKEIGAGIK